MGILAIIGNALKLAAEWVMGYNRKENMNARKLEDEQRKIDDFRKAMNERDIEEVRRRLSG